MVIHILTDKGCITKREEWDKLGGLVSSQIEKELVLEDEKAARMYRSYLERKQEEGFWTFPPIKKLLRNLSYREVKKRELEVRRQYEQGLIKICRKCGVFEGVGERKYNIDSNKRKPRCERCLRKK